MVTGLVRPGPLQKMVQADYRKRHQLNDQHEKTSYG